MIASSLIISIACALVAKKRCDQKGKTNHAYATYSLWAGVAVIICSIISILMNTIIKDWNVTIGFNAFIGKGNLDSKAPWQLLVFSASFLTTYQLNSQKVHKIDAKNLRIKEAILMGFVLCATLLIAGSLMSFDTRQFFRRGIVLYFVGFIIGFYIPTWYRGVPKSEKETNAYDAEAELST